RATSASTRPVKKAGGFPDWSLAETSVGPEMSQELSCDDFSQELPSTGLQDMSAQEFSILTGESTGLGGELSMAGLPDIDEQQATTSGMPKLRPRVLQAANLAALVAVPRDEPGGSGFRQHYRKKVLCVARLAAAAQPADAPKWELPKVWTEIAEPKSFNPSARDP
ncbi:unnamed protein product, partial [Symbiodinium pilosum]